MEIDPAARERHEKLAKLAGRPAPKWQFTSPAEFFGAVHETEIGGPRDQRLIMAAISGAGEGAGVEGGFLVPDPVSASLWEATYAVSQILRRCERQPLTTSSKLTIPAISESSRAAGSRFGGVVMNWVSEGEAPTETIPKFRAIHFALKKLLGIAYATGELVNDAPAFEAHLRRVFSLEAAHTLDEALIRGSGAGEPLGALNSDALISVQKESGQAANTVLPENLINMALRLWPPSHMRARWYVGPGVFGQIAGAQFANGTPVIEYAAGERFVLGLPLELTEHTLALGSKGDILLADFSQTLVTEQSPEFIGSIHVRFLEHENCFRFRFRADAAPAWAEPITLENTAATVSPYVALDERS
jgi:HK97 family phage major capsid protein